MRISDIRIVGLNVTPKTNWLFLRVTTQGGRVGWGEATLANHEDAMAAEASRLAGEAIGRDARDRGLLARLLPHVPGGLVRHTAISAFEQALTDLAAQDAGVSIARLLGGGRHDPITLYANINRGTDPRTPDGFAAAARRAVAHGFRAIKLAPFDGVVWEDAAERDQRAHVTAGIACIAAVREAVGPEVDVMVDCHWRFSPAGAAALIRALASLDLYWIECPIAEANLPELRRLRGLANDRGMRLAGAETLAGMAAYRPLIETGAYDVLMPDIKHAGGHVEIQRIAALAQTAGVEIAPHNPTGPICHAHSLHLCATLTNFLILEVQFGESPLFHDCVQGADLLFRDGAAGLPSGPGLGVTVNEALAQDRPPVPIPQPWLDPRLG